MTDTTPERRAHRDDEAFDDFVAFCRSRPNESFQYMDNDDCAYARFLKETGRCAHPMVGGWDWKPRNAPDSECVWLDGRLLSNDGTDSPLGCSRTFGEILQKLGLDS